MAMPHPAVWYRMNDNVATTNVLDYGTGDNNGTANANTDTLDDAGKINGGLHFDGSATRIDANGAGSAYAGDTTGTIAFWVKFDAFTAVQTLFEFCDASANDWLQATVGTDGKLDYWVNDGDVGDCKWGATSAFSTATWYHIVIVHNATTPTFYVNGALWAGTFATTTVQSTWMLANQDELHLGVRDNAYDAASYYLDAILDDFRYYSGTAFTADQAALLCDYGTNPSNYTVHPEHHFWFDNEEGNQVYPNYGQGKFDAQAPDATASRNTSFLHDDSVKVQVASCGMASSQSDQINIDALSSHWNGDTTGTLSMWVYVDSTATEQHFFNVLYDQNGPADYFKLGMEASGAIDVMMEGTGTKWRWRGSGNGVLADTTWYHIVVVQDGTAKFYINNVAMAGSFLDSTDTSAWFASSGTAYDTGRIACSRHQTPVVDQAFTSGNFDDFRYYKNVALDADDVNAIYKLGDGSQDSQVLKYSDATATPDAGAITVAVPSHTLAVTQSAGGVAGVLTVEDPTYLVTPTPGAAECTLSVETPAPQVKIFPDETSLALTAEEPADVKGVGKAYDPVVKRGCPQCGTLLYNYRGVQQRTGNVHWGRNFDLEQDEYMKCGRCGFRVNTKKRRHSRDESREGWGITYTQIDRTAVG